MERIISFIVMLLVWRYLISFPEHTHEEEEEEESLKLMWR